MKAVLSYTKWFSLLSMTAVSSCEERVIMGDRLSSNPRSPTMGVLSRRGNTLPTS